MGLACSQARLLTLTARKADCELGLSLDSMHKMALTREMSDLSTQYYNKLKAKQVCFYANGKYNKINAGYLMGYGADINPILEGSKPLKENNSMLLADYKGRIVLNQDYANAIMAVCGNNIIDGDGRGGTFSASDIPQILEKLTCGAYSAEQYKEVIDGKTVQGSYDGTGVNLYTGESTGESETVDSSDTISSNIQKLVNFFLPIFTAAATNGWTTEYNNEIALNDDYVSDAIASGTFQLIGVDESGNFDNEMSLTYFLTSGQIETRSDSEQREEITAWYNAEKDRISEKESYIDIHMDNLSTELEAIKTEIQAIESLVDDAIESVFDWGGG